MFSRYGDYLRLFQTAPFLIKTFVKVGKYHHLSQFEEGPLPVADEQQVYTWYVLPTHTIPMQTQQSYASSQERCHTP